MKEVVTVDKALNRGHLILTIPSFLIYITTLGFAFYMVIIEILSTWAILVSFFLSFFLMLLYSLVMTVKWRLWAFENVVCVQELKKRGIQENLIPKEKDSFKKWEYWNRKDKARWLALEPKLSLEDPFIDDLNIPRETIVVQSKWKNSLEIIFMVFVFGVGLVSIFYTESPVFGTIACVVSLLITYRQYHKAIDERPQITINEFGIKTLSTGFVPWEEVKEERISGYGAKNHLFCFLFEHPRGEEILKISSFNISMRRLSKLLILYRKRYEHRVTSDL